MSNYYCHECGINLRFLEPVEPTTNFTGSNYMLQKFYKHTIPPNSQGVISIFDQPDYDKYKNYIVNTSASGSVEQDNAGRVNIIWFAGSETGFTYVNGVFQEPINGVKLVLHTSPTKIHAYPTSSDGFQSRLCTNCGKPIIT